MKSTEITEPIDYKFISFQINEKIIVSIIVSVSQN